MTGPRSIKLIVVLLGFALLCPPAAPPTQSNGMSSMVIPAHALTPSDQVMAVRWLAQPFMWSTGLESTTVVDTSNRLRALDEYALTQVYSQFRQDIDNTASLGATTIRFAIPWYRVETAPGRFNWSWTDQVMDYIRQKRLDPIIDLTHYGTPAWILGSFADPSYPREMANFASAFATRYPWVRMYVAFNEPAVAAEFGSLRGVWPPYLQGNQGYVKILLSLAQGMQDTVQAIRRVKPNVVIIDVESSTMNHETAADPFLHSMLAWDLVNGRVNGDHPLYQWLLDQGATAPQLAMLQANAVHEDVFGVNFYTWNTRGNDTPHLVPSTGQQLVECLKQIYGYTHVPVFITETGAWGTYELRASWMSYTVAAVAKARSEQIPVIGYTWYPTLDMISWDYRTTEKSLESSVMHMGLWEGRFDANGVYWRVPTPLVAQFRGLIRRGMR